MSTPKPTPRLPSRPAANSDAYTWLGVIWLLMLGGGFLAFLMLMVNVINVQVLLGFLVFLALNVFGHVILGRWVARRIAASSTDADDESE